MEPKPLLASGFSRLPMTSDGSRDFDYASLPLNPETQDIRILSLQISSFLTEANESPITCSLSVTPLGTNPWYLALSYVWGDPVRCKEVIVNGQRTNITLNLDLALRRLSTWFQQNDLVNEDGTVAIWVDSLCIDQDNNAEKSSQVSKMGDIFSRASRVVAWLGEASNNSDMALECVHFLAGLDPDTLQLEKIKNHLEVNGGAAIYPLFERPYFFRAWIFQELVLGKNVSLVCGMASVDGDSAARAVQILDDLQISDLRSTLNQGITRAIWFKGELPIPLFQARAEFIRHNRLCLFVTLARFRDRGLQASDERDHVYSLLGLACDVDRLEIQPDYSRPWPSVFQDVTEKMLKQGLDDIYREYGFPDSLSLLLVTCRTEPHKELPSWVPNWSESRRSTSGANAHFALSRESFVGSYSASGTSAYSYYSSGKRHGKALEVRGVCHGLIELIGPSRVECEGRSPDERWIKEWVESVMAFAEKIKRDGEDYIQAASRTLVCDVNHAHDVARIHPDRYELLKDVCINLIENPGNPLRPPDWPYCDVEVKQQSGNTRAFTTSSKTLGLGPAQARLGDEVWVIIGVCVPMVLRKNGKGDHTIVGPAYVHGIMDGEFFESTDERESISLV